MTRDIGALLLQLPLLLLLLMMLLLLPWSAVPPSSHPTYQWRRPATAT